MSDRPNILLLFGEQHRWDCMGCAGHPVLLTPTLDWIGAGARFTNAYSTCPVCVPARRSLISGQFPGTHGARANISAEWNPPHTLASVLRDSGYQTAWIGRSMHQDPPRKPFGFEEVVMFDHRDPADYGAFLERNMPEGFGGYYGSGVMHNDWTARPFHMPENLHHTNWTVHEAMRFLERRDRDRPFCMAVSFLASHPPLVPPACYFDRYIRTGVPDPVIGDWATPPPNGGIGLGASALNVDLKGEALLSARAGYYGLIDHMDDQIRRLVNGVEGGVPLHNTVVVYTADHGEMLGDHYLWAKGYPYEGSAHVPFVVRVPQGFGCNHGEVIDKPVCLEDVMPTLLELGGAPIPDCVEGRSLVPLLRGQHPAWRDFVRVEYRGQAEWSHDTLTDGREKYIRFARDGREQFFDLARDPEERHDLVSDPSVADRIATWRERLP